MATPINNPESFFKPPSQLHALAAYYIKKNAKDLRVMVDQSMGETILKIINDKNGKVISETACKNMPDVKAKLDELVILFKGT